LVVIVVSAQLLLLLLLRVLTPKAGTRRVR
jgi:hypothetical protein